MHTSGKPCTVALAVLVWNFLQRVGAGNQSDRPITLHGPLSLSVQGSRVGGFRSSVPDHRWANGIAVP